MPERYVYMDHNATTPIHPEVKKAMIEGMEYFGNASSFHYFGRLARKHIENAREIVAGFIGANPDEIIFVGSGSEANNTVLNIYACQCPCCGVSLKQPKEIITSNVEHPCILRTVECLRERGTTVRYADVDSSGKVDLTHLKNLVTENTGLVSIMMANNEIGTLMDIKEIAKSAHDKGVLVHTDAVQAVGKVSVNVNDLKVDFLTMSAHKFYGPKGVGALYVRKGAPFCPMIRGGHQEKGRRAGTENTLGIIGMAKAIEMLKTEMAPSSEKLKKLKQRLREGITQTIKDIYFNGHIDDSLPGTLNVSFDGVEGEAVLLYLDMEGIAVSTGSACASGSLDPSHVLLATGIGAEKAHGSIRFSLGKDNTMEDVEYVLKKFPPIIEKLRKMSTAYAKG
ncbi:cysteine desulfurase NifS [Candidatus Omnitrophus magneticus]|uniref:cysteine desulfurase n=1 Tax=Candidatus Omnitrophus magneticus TaxID=1609969 RepID=A0A0F0CV69_9BACT|nr:cysteine desulfurase NifS [Candidatus Omnitrophus magneticus]